MTQIKLKAGDFVYSAYFGQWLKILKVENDNLWWFEKGGAMLKAQTPLSHFVNTGNYRKVQK